MLIPTPTIPADHPDAALMCEEALADAVLAIVERHPAHNWRGNEWALQRLRREAIALGWRPDEVDRALPRLAYASRFALEPGRPE
jgi:hypothetical protein